MNTNLSGAISLLAGIVFALFAQGSLLAQDTVTNVISPIVSYQYYDALDTTTNSVIVSPIASYQYFDCLDATGAQFLKSPPASFYYPFLNTPQFVIIPTTRLPTESETTPAFILPTLAQLNVFTNGSFQPMDTLDPTRMTIVLTHGWIHTIPFETVSSGGGPEGWPTDVDTKLQANGVTANIAAWNWTNAAKSFAMDPGTAEARTPDQGIALGQALTNALGAGYLKPVHFIGHSLGTLVNAYAANFLQGTNWATEPKSSNPWPGTNMQMTLFDEAEVATGLTEPFQGLSLLIGRNGNPFYPKPSYDHPLPRQCAWADNYISAFGLLHPEAVNVILTNDFPSDAPNWLSWMNGLAAFHSYPFGWYEETIQSDISPMGYLWSFERGGCFSQAPKTNSVYVQAASEWNLAVTNWLYGTNLLNSRFQEYRNGLADSIQNETPGRVTANGSVNGLTFDALPTASGFVVNLLKTPVSESFSPNVKPRLAANAQADQTNATTPAYVWMQLNIPDNAISMSFDYKIQGEWNNDLLTAALGGTNVLSIPGSQIQTNTLFSSGLIDVTALAGRTNEIFVGIVGDTSTNAQLTVQNLVFYSLPIPSLQAAVLGDQIVLTWPLLSQGFQLQATTNLSDPNSWITQTNVSSIMNLQNTFTNPISAGSKFYRLQK